MVLFQAWTSFSVAPSTAKSWGFPFSPFGGIDTSNNEEDTKCFDICSTNSASFLTYDDDWFFPNFFSTFVSVLLFFGEILHSDRAMPIGWKVKRHFASSISQIHQIGFFFLLLAEIYPWSFKWKKFGMNRLTRLSCLYKRKPSLKPPA